jgi:hypothetical protein
MTTTAALLRSSPLVWSAEAVTRIQPSGIAAPFVPYSYQARILADRAPRLLVLKARQVGVSYAAALLVAHHVLHNPRSLALLISRDQGAAANLLGTVYDVLDGLNEPPQFERRGVYECTLGNDARIVSQPATAKAGRGLTASLVILDEFAFADHDARIYRAVLPTLSRGGRLLVISTPNGINNLFYKLWAGDEGGEWSQHRIHWSDCPVFTDEWAEAEKGKHTAQSWASEYECDFIESGGAVFNLADVEAMRFGWCGEQAAQPGHTYVSGWDIERHHDATVGVTLDVTTQPYQVVRYERLQRAQYAQIVSLILQREQEYHGRTFVEANSMGDPLVEACEGRVKPFVTTQASKANMLTRLIRLVEQGNLKAGAEQLLSELRSYQWDDRNLVQDSVMALAIAVQGIGSAGPIKVAFVSTSYPSLQRQWFE